MRLTKLLAAAYPEFPPYEGAFEQIVPHVTVAQADDEALLAQIEREVHAFLPIEAHAREALLLVEGADGRWHERRRFPLG